jgi:hypothetical protein
MIAQQREMHAAQLDQILDFRAVTCFPPRFKAKN